MSLYDRRRNVAVLVTGTMLLATAMAGCNAAPTAARPAGATRAPNQAGSKKGEVPLTDVKLELLQRAPATLEEPNRNPFRFEARSAPAQASARSTTPARDAAPGVPQRPAVVPAPAGPAPVPPIPLRFIGFMEAPTQAGRVAVMSDGRGNVFYGREGDTIEGRYKMLKVDPEVVELTYVDGRGRQTIRLSGQ
jgi:hypothetical protein